VVQFELVRAVWLSGEARSAQASTVMIAIWENPAFPFLAWKTMVGPNEGDAIYVDNAFLQTWNETGIGTAVALVCVFVWILFRDGVKSPFLGLFLTASLSGNIIYLWPVAYFFWINVGSPLERLSSPTVLAEGERS
jgi:hypothetical protein